MPVAIVVNARLTVPIEILFGNIARQRQVKRASEREREKIIIRLNSQSQRRADKS